MCFKLKQLFKQLKFWVVTKYYSLLGDGPDGVMPPMWYPGGAAGGPPELTDWDDTIPAWQILQDDTPDLELPLLGEEELVETTTSSSSPNSGWSSDEVPLRNPSWTSGETTQRAQDQDKLHRQPIGRDD